MCKLGDKSRFTQMANTTEARVFFRRDSFLYPNNKIKYHVSVSTESVTLVELTKNGRDIVLQYRDILGCDCMKGKKTADTSSYLSLFTYALKKKIIGNSSVRQRRVYTLEFNEKTSYDENLSEALSWRNVITSLARGISMGKLENLKEIPLPRTKKWLFLVNPHSGPGKALSIFQQRVVPMLAEAAIEFSLIVTKHAGHAVELMKSLNLEEWYCVVIVSGDGLIFEAINGLMQRRDWESAIQFPIGCLPGGSGNALACALSHAAKEPYLEAQVLHSTYLLIKHHQLAMDLVAVETSSGKRLYSFLSVTWGLTSDVDIESEKYRSLGNTRFTLAALIKLVGFKKYHGRVSFLPFDKYTPRISNPKIIRRTQSEYPHTDSTVRVTSVVRAQSMIAEGQGQEAPVYTQTGAGDAGSAYDNGVDSEEGLVKAEFGLETEPDISPPGIENETGNCVTVAGEGLSASAANSADETGSRLQPETPLLVPLSDPVPDTWVTLEDEFVSVIFVYLSHLGPDFIVSPDIKLDEGCIYLVMIHRNATRTQLLKLMMQLAEGAVDYNSTSAVELVKVRAFRLVPLTEKGFIAVDGEQVDYGPIQGQILPKMANIMGVYARD